MWVLGVSAFRDDACAALLHDGAIVGIAEEERFIRVKHAVQPPLSDIFVTSLDEDRPLPELELRYFPKRAIDYLLTEARIEYTDIDIVAFDLDLRHRLTHWSEYQPMSEAAPAANGSLEYWARTLQEFSDQCNAKLVYVRHHLAHASGAVFGSGYSNAAFLVVDAFGETDTTTLGTFDGRFRIHRSVGLPDSLGVFYSAVTRFLGFRPYSDEQKTMGLAAYGDPSVYGREFERIIAPSSDGFRLRQEAVWGREVMGCLGYESTLGRILGVSPRVSGTDACRRPYIDVAAAAQAALEGVLHNLVDILFRCTSIRTLCLAGGVALNCSANGRIGRRDDVEQIYIQPQAGDAGTALGAAYFAHFAATGSRPEPLGHAYWGPSFRAEEVRNLLDDLKLDYSRSSDIAGETAQLLAHGKIVGHFSGRSECGPRALGNRSILADPGQRSTRDLLNGSIKHREWWRPFGASILSHRQREYLSANYDASYMLQSTPLTAEGSRVLQAASHVDDTTRPQVVDPATNKRLHDIIEGFERHTGVGALLNTSLNTKGEPILNTPTEALRLFFTTGVDALVLEDCVLKKTTGNVRAGPTGNSTVDRMTIDEAE